jgi:hypothetical protein
MNAQSEYPDVAAEAAPEPSKPQEAEGNTALLPKSIFGGDVAAGQECTFKVVHVYEDEVEVSYESKSGDDKPTPPEPDAVDAQIDNMAT